MPDQLNELNSNKVIKLRNLLTEIVKNGFSIIDKFNGGTKHISVIVYANYFIRFIYCFESVLILLKDFEKNKAYREYSIALILRASLLDFLTVIYLKSYYEELNTDSNNSLPNYNSEFTKLLSSQIRRSFILSKSEKNNKNFKPEVFKRFVDKVHNNYSYLFHNNMKLNYDSPAEALIYSKREDEISNSVIKKRLNSVAYKSSHDHISIFNLYDHYSKYDHFGLIGINLQRLDINEIFQNILTSLYYLVDGISYSMEFMRNEEDIEVEYNEIWKRCGSLRGTVITKYLYLSEEYKSEN